MSDIAAKRTYVYNMYDAPGWHKKVNKMSDTQIIAIFLREQNKAQTSSKESTDDDESQRIPF